MKEYGERVLRSVKWDEWRMADVAALIGEPATVIRRAVDEGDIVPYTGVYPDGRHYNAQFRSVEVFRFALAYARDMIEEIDMAVAAHGELLARLEETARIMNDRHRGRLCLQAVSDEETEA